MARSSEPTPDEGRRRRRHVNVLPRNYVIALAMARRLDDDEAGRDFSSYDIVYEIHRASEEIAAAVARSGTSFRFDERDLQMAGTTLERALYAMATADDPLLEQIAGPDRASRENRYALTGAGRDRAEPEVVNLAGRANPPWPPLMDVLHSVLPGATSRRGSGRGTAAPDRGRASRPAPRRGG